MATKLGSVDSLNVSIQRGCNLKARHTLRTVETESPDARAMPREAQCMAPSGKPSKVSTILARSAKA